MKPQFAPCIRLASAALLALSLGCDSDPVSPSVGTPSAIAFTDPAPRTGTVGLLVAPVPVARVTDSRGNGLAGMTVLFDLITAGGTITGDSGVTDAQGRIALGSWRLGALPRTETLRAQVRGYPLSTTLNITAGVGNPTSIQIVAGVSGVGLSALINDTVPLPPVVWIRDGFGNSVPESEVTWRIMGGGGTIVGPTVTRTDAEGRATIRGWRMGAVPGTNLLEAKISSGVSTTISATAVEIPQGIYAFSPESQTGVSSFQVEKTPRVLVLGSGNQPLAGVPISFSLTSGPGTGSISGTLVTTGSDGIAALGDWKIGASGASTVVARVVGLPDATVAFSASGTPLPFTIDLRFITPPPPDLRDLFVRATRRWMEVITGDLPDQSVNIPSGTCVMDNAPALVETVDDLVVFADLTPIDGPKHILGQANFCAVRFGSRLPVVGGMQLDIEDALALAADGVFESVVLHEMGHVLGLNRFNWVPLQLMTGVGGDDPIFTGTAALSGWTTLNIVYAGQPVPIENEFGEGTRDSHWRESVLGPELMTGIIEEPGVSMPLSALTIGALADAGYEVDITRAEVFIPTLRSALLRMGPRIPLGETIVPPGHVVDRQGVVRRIR